jgi:uncharacterized OsmC-like protein
MIEVRDHQIVVDQPVEDGGEDTSASPTELFVAGLVSCIAFYARRYLARHDLPEEGLLVTATYDLVLRPARVADVRVQLQLPDAVPDERRQALLAVATHCTVHNSLTTPPDVTVELVSTTATSVA